MNQDLQDYIKKARGAGMNDGQIKQELLKAGWQEQDINQEFGGVFVPTPTPSAPKAEAFSETTTQRGKSKLFTIIMVIVIAVVLIGGGVLGYTYLIKPSAPKNVVDNNIVDNNIVSNQENQAANNEIARPNNETVKPVVKNCGNAQFVSSTSADNVNGSGVSGSISITTPVPKTTNDKEALKCFMNAVGNCQKAKISISGEDEGSVVYEVNGKENQNCLAVVTSVPDSKNNRTCSVSLKVISTIKEEINKSPDTAWELMLPFGLLLSMSDSSGDQGVSCK